MKNDYALCFEKNIMFDGLKDSSQIMFVEKIPNPIEVMGLLSSFSEDTFCHVLEVEFVDFGTNFVVKNLVKTFGGFQSFGV